MIKLVFLLFVLSCNAKKGLRVDKFEVCGCSPEHSLKVSKISLSYTPQIGYFVDLVGEIRRDLNSPLLRAEARLERCANKEALDSCEYYGTLKPSSICALVTMGGVMFKQFSDQFTPPLRCPFKKGFIYGHNVTFNVEVFKMFQIDGYYWRGNGSIFEGDKYLGSICAAGSVLSLRNLDNV